MARDFARSYGEFYQRFYLGALGRSLRMAEADQHGGCREYGDWKHYGWLGRISDVELKIYTVAGVDARPYELPDGSHAGGQYICEMLGIHPTKAMQVASRRGLRSFLRSEKREYDGQNVRIFVLYERPWKDEDMPDRVGKLWRPDDAVERVMEWVHLPSFAEACTYPKARNRSERLDWFDFVLSVIDRAHEANIRGNARTMAYHTSIVDVARSGVWLRADKQTYGFAV